MAIFWWLTFLNAVILVLAGPQCLDESGTSVDWYMVYKLPRLADTNDGLFTGHRYAYLTSKSTSGWTMSSLKIDDNKSVFGRTLSQVFQKSDLSTVFYNDESPTGEQVPSSFAHAKGALAGNGKQGFWLIHSVPKFMDVNGSYNYPENGYRFGQSALCISLSTSGLASVVSQNLLVSRPYVYRSAIAPVDSPLNDAIRQLQSGKWVKSPFVDVSLTSLGGNKFRSFYKSPGDHVDLYSSIVAPAVGAPLLVETWRKNPGDPLDSNCTKPAIEVENVKEIKVAFKSGSGMSGAFSYLDDHSKWAISGNQSTANLVCIGDINRMHSQFKRGGGTTCVKATTAWKAYQSFVGDIDKCN